MTINDFIISIFTHKRLYYFTITIKHYNQKYLSFSLLTIPVPEPIPNLVFKNYFKFLSASSLKLSIFYLLSLKVSFGVYFEVKLSNFNWTGLKWLVHSSLAVGCSLKGFSTKTVFLSFFIVLKEYLLEDSFSFKLDSSECFDEVTLKDFSLFPSLLFVLILRCLLQSISTILTSYDDTDYLLYSQTTSHSSRSYSWLVFRMSLRD